MLGDLVSIFFWKKIKNVSGNQRPVQPSWILNHSKKEKHFFRTPRLTFIENHLWFLQIPKILENVYLLIKI
jgi:hypothetical protein